MTDISHLSPAPGPTVSGREERVGMLLVFLSAFVWSTGGTIARFLEADGKRLPNPEWLQYVAMD